MESIEHEDVVNAELHRSMILEDRSQAIYIPLESVGQHDANHLQSQKTRFESTVEQPCCELCHSMLEECLQPAFSYSDEEIILTDEERRELRDLGEEFFSFWGNLDVGRLETSKARCGLCRLIFDILRGPDGILLYQIKAYEGDQFNPALAYSEHGVSDHEAMRIRKGRRKRVNLGIVMQFCRSSANSNVDRLMIDLEVNFWTQKKQATTKIHRPLIAFATASLTIQADSLPVSLAPDTRLDYDKKLAMIRSWLTGHLSEDTGEERVYPTRLLDVSHRDRIKLVQYPCLSDPNCNKPLRVPYVALSHRWGSARHLIATSSTLAQLERGIDTLTLPQTFRDAAQLTLHLGMQYLWIDALCIVQDNPDDWLHESQKMGDVFMNARVTLAVHCAQDDSEGFLLHALAKRTALKHNVKGYAVGICLPPDPESDVTNSKLSKRGWVLQERFLASRCIHLTTGQIYLESAEGILCEDGSMLDHQDRTKFLSPDNSLHSSKPSSARFHSPHSLLEVRDALGFPSSYSETQSPPLTGTTLEWLDVIEMYSRCELTKEADKLIAISGMARKIHGTRKQRWCAGIWSDYICQGLLWLPTTSGLAKPTQQRAPSWSWAAWDGPIQYPLVAKKPSFAPMCEVVDLQNMDNESVGWLNGVGRLSLRGMLFPLPSSSLAHSVSIGPGPRRRDCLDGLDVMALEDYVTARPIHGRYSRLKHGLEGASDHTYHPYGWIALDAAEEEHKTDDQATSDYGAEYLDHEPVFTNDQDRFLVLGTDTFNEESDLDKSSSYGKEMISGIFLTQSGSPAEHVYKRKGIGQVCLTNLNRFVGGEDHWDRNPYFEHSLRKTLRHTERMFTDMIMTTVTME